MALVLDAGALIAIDRGDRAMSAKLLAAERRRLAVCTSAIVIAQAWRDSTGRQARLARALRAVDVRPVDEPLARAAGILLGRSGTSDAIDATVVLLAEDGDSILTSDPADIARLVTAAGRRVAVIAC